MKIFFVEQNGIVRESVSNIKSVAEEYFGKLYEIELPSSVKEAVFREVEHKYLLADADYHVEEYILSNTGLRPDLVEEFIKIRIPNYDDFLEKCVKRYEKTCDCNIDQNSTWREAVSFVFKEVQSA